MNKFSLGYTNIMRVFCKLLLNERIHYHLPVISSLFVKVNVTYDLTFLSYVTVEEIESLLINYISTYRLYIFETDCQIHILKYKVIFLFYKAISAYFVSYHTDLVIKKE